MPARTIDDADLLEHLSRLFRTVGYDGASLTDIAAATGLRKSSLYHRFPGGKAQMAAEAARSTAATLASAIEQALARAGDPVRQAEAVAAELRAFYAGGECGCLLETLSLGDADAATVTALADAAAWWVDAFADIARRAGRSEVDAVRCAEDAIATIEGALVLARVRRDTSVFERAIDRLPAQLTDR